MPSCGQVRGAGGCGICQEASRERSSCFLEPVSAGVGIGFALVGLQYPVLTAPDSVLRLIAVEGVRLERHIYLILPSVGETSPAARRFADQLLRIRPAGS